MPSFLDTRETSERFGNRISEFCALFDTNHIRHGSPDDIFEFAKTLETSNQFRLDLSAMVKATVQKESDELLLTDMMGILVASVGGPSFATTHADITKPNNILMEFLLGTGCWRQFGSPSPAGSRNAAPPLKPTIRAEPVRAEEPRPVRISRPVPIVPIAGDTLENRATLLEISSELQQMLTRLEIDTQQVKLHLASIEKRISKTEQPSNIPTMPARTSPLEPLLHPKSPAMVSAEAEPLFAKKIAASEPELPNRSRAVFSHPLQADRSRIDDLPTPTFIYSDEKGRRMLPIAVFLILLVTGLSLFFTHSEKGRILLEDGMSRLKTISTPSGSAPATAPNGSTAIPASTSTPPSAPTTTAPATAAPALPPPAGPAASTKSLVETAPKPAMGTSGPSSPSPDARAALDNSKFKYVPANVMEGYLLSAPKPEYPPLARIEHIEGSVALQVTISKMGSMTTIHVIKGPQILRAAAIDAVRNWRYKPYSVDGRPSDVATTVYVDFTLRPPPAITH